MNYFLPILFAILCSTSLAQTSPQPVEFYFPSFDPLYGNYQIYDYSTGTYLNTFKCNDYDLLAGSTYLDYGAVRICNNDTHVMIGVFAINGFKLNTVESVKIWTEACFDNFPSTGGCSQKEYCRGRVGAYSYKSNFASTSTVNYYWSVVIPYSSFYTCSDPTISKVSCDDKIYAYVHVDTFDGQTAFGGLDTNSTAYDSTRCYSGPGSWFCSIYYYGSCT